MGDACVVAGIKGEAENTLAERVENIAWFDVHEIGYFFVPAEQCIVQREKSHAPSSDIIYDRLHVFIGPEN